MLHKQIQRVLEQAVQALLIILLIRLRHSRERPRNLLLLTGILRGSVGGSLSILHEHLNHIVRLGLLGANQQFVVPCVLGVGIVLADVPRGGLALLDLPFPILVGRCPLLEVEVFRKWEGLALVQAFLVEEERLLEWCEVSGDLGWAGEDHAGVDDMAGFYDGEGSGRRSRRRGRGLCWSGGSF